MSSETVKRTTLRAYARPPKQQQARVLMYDPIRRIIPEYFARGRTEDILLRCEETLNRKHFDDAGFEEKWRKSNRSALVHIRMLDLRGSFEDVRTRKASIIIGKFDVLSTVDFYGRYVPANGKPKMVGVIFYPSGIRKRSPEDRKRWAEIEGEVGFRSAIACDIAVEEILYVDLPRNELYRFKAPRARIWSEIDATCERIFRDWRDLRLEMASTEEGRA